MSLLIVLAAALVPGGQMFTCTPTRVWDGDGPIWCAEGPRIRLSGIAAREIGGDCKQGHPCPLTDAIDARDHLVQLLGERRGHSAEGHVLVSGPPLQCRSVGGAGGDRTAAWCSSPRAGDLSCAMVTSGHAVRWERYWKGHRCS